MLGRSLIRTQWISLFILFVGIAIVQVQNAGATQLNENQVQNIFNYRKFRLIIFILESLYRFWFRYRSLCIFWFRWGLFRKSSQGFDRICLAQKYSAWNFWNDFGIYWGLFERRRSDPRKRFSFWI